MTEPLTTVCYEFGGFRLDPRRRLFSGPDGEPIALKPKVFDTLVHFVEHPDVLLDKRTLMRAVWGDVVVEENSLNQHISTLRRVLGEDAGENRFIVTVIGRGYRFVSPVRTDTQAASQQDALLPTRRRLAPMVAIVAGTAIGVVAVTWLLAFSSSSTQRAGGARAVAVLPCRNDSPDPDQAHLAAGIHEALIEQVAKASFHVIASTSVMPYRDTAKSIPEIARELSVGENRIDAVIECSVRYADGRVRVGVALADAATSDTLWRETYDRELGDIFAVESNIALRVAEELKATLSPAQVATLEAIPSRSARAIELYFSARRYEQLGSTNWPVAAEQYERAIAEDPQFALAHAQLALLHISMSQTFGGPESLNQARTAAEAALQLQPDLVQGLIAAVAYRLYARAETPQAVLEELQALEPRAERTFEFYSTRRGAYEQLGRMEEALADSRRAADLGPPRDVPLLLFQTKYQMLLRRYEEAAEVFRHVTDIAPDDWGMQVHRASLPLYQDGDTAALLALQDQVWSGAKPIATPIFQAFWVERDSGAALRMLDMSPGSPEALFKQLYRGLLYHSAGEFEKAKPSLEAVRDQLAAMLESAPPEQRAGMQLARGLLLACLGATTEALQSTEEGLAGLRELSVGDAYPLHLDAAYAFANAGATERAIAELDTYLSNPGFWSGAGLARLPLLAPIRDDARFAALVARHTAR